jgi:hypothetical protein
MATQVKFPVILTQDNGYRNPQSDNYSITLRADLTSEDYNLYLPKKIDFGGYMLSDSKGQTEFTSDIVTNNLIITDTADPTKKITFDASSISPGQTRTITMADSDVDLSLISENPTFTSVTVRDNYDYGTTIDLYQYPTTYDITGGGTALKDSITANGGGVGPTSPNVYEIKDDLTYTAGITLTDVSYIVVRGAVGNRPTISVDATNTTCFRINYDLNHGSTSYIWLGNMDASISIDSDTPTFLYINRQGSALDTDTVDHVYVKDVFIYNTSYFVAGVSRSGINCLTQINSPPRFVDTLVVEECRFKDLTPRTDRGAILLLGVSNYVGRKNMVSSPNISTSAYSSRGVCIFRGSSGREYNSTFMSGDVGQYNVEFNSPACRIVMDQYVYGGYASDITWEFVNCTFGNCQSTTTGAFDIYYRPNEPGSPGVESEVMNIILKDCKFVNSIGGVAIESYSNAGLRGIDLLMTRCNFENCINPIRQLANYTCPYHSLFIEGNVYEFCGVPLSGFSNDYKYNTGSSEATGLYLQESHSIRAALVDANYAGVSMSPTYISPNVSTVTRHNYLTLNNTAGTAPVSDACAFRFTQAPAIHKAVDGPTTKTTPSGVDAWIKINVNGTIYYMPAYLSKTA